MPFHQNENQVNFPVFIADIPDECLLRADFLAQFQCHLSMADYYSAPMYWVLSVHRIAETIRTTEAVQVKPQEEVVLCASFGSGRGSRWTYRVTPIPVHDPNKISRNHRRAGIREALVARAEVLELADDLPVRIWNPTTRTMNLPKGTAVAECVVLPKLPEVQTGEEWDFSRVSVDVPVGSTAADVNPQPEMDLNRDFPEVMKPLVQNVDVDTPEQKSRLVDILYRHQEAFSLQGELGHTDLVYHHVNTGDATPVKQPPRRLPLFAGPEADKCMAEMKEAGVIVSCDGEEMEWESPIVLVKKINGPWRFCIDPNAERRCVRPQQRLWNDINLSHHNYLYV